MNTQPTSIFRGVVLACAFAAIAVAPAHAYIDPGTGSMIFQILAAAFFGAIYAIKLYWQKLKDFFTGAKPPTCEAEKPDQKPAATSGTEPPPADKK